MKYKSTVSVEGLTSKDLRRMIDCGTLEPGDRLVFEGQTWKVLKKDEKSILIFRAQGSTVCMALDERDEYDYDTSAVREYLHSDKFLATIPEEIRENAGESLPELLSVTEVTELMPRQIDRIVCDECGDTIWWPTRSASRGYASHTWYVNSSGNVYYYSAHGAYRFAPACGLTIHRNIE